MTQKLILVKGKKTKEKSNYIDSLYNDSSKRIFLVDRDEFARITGFSVIKSSRRQREIIKEVIDFGLTIVVNCFGFNRQKWMEIANNKGIVYEEIDFDYLNKKLERKDDINLSYFDTVNNDVKLLLSGLDK